MCGETHRGFESHTLRHHRPARANLATMARDTTPEAQAVQDAVMRSLGGARRIELVVEMTAAAEDVTRAGIRSRHPEYTDREVQLTAWRLRWGDDLYRAALPDAPVLPA